MLKPENTPKTLMEAVEHFADPKVCFDYLCQIRWDDGNPTCPKCKSDRIGHIRRRQMFQCKDCRKQFSIKVGTIFEDSALPLNKWFVAIWSISNCKNGISSCELARAIGTTQKSAWHVLHRVRMAMRAKSFRQLDGTIESDESFIGGKFRNMHKSKRDRLPRGRGTVGKAIVHGMVERGGEAVAGVVKDQSSETLKTIVCQNVKPGSRLYTDTLASYKGFGNTFVHAND